MSSLFENDSPSNLAEYSVSELSGSIKRTVENAFDQVRVRGEISGYRGPHSSGHAYFSLKDDRSRIDAVIWKGSFSKLKFRPEEGMEVIATGKVTTFPGSSKYQIVIETLEPAGAGALMALIEERKRKLGAEGLFDADRKKPLPFMPKVIGVVTSPTGAVIRDILHRIADRFPVHVLVWPVKVQGEGSGSEVANAIRGFNAFERGGAMPRPDVLIVARGGGSLEDLWSFNDEIVVRAAAESTIPLVSAVGHETDWTLIDYAADVRAPTPTGAAEMAVPVKADLEAQAAGLSARLQTGIRRHMDHHGQSVRALVRALPSLDQLLALPRRRFDETAAGLGRGLELNTLNKRRSFERAAAHLRPEVLSTRIAEKRQKLNERMVRAERRVERLLLDGHKRISNADVAMRGVPARLTAQTRSFRDRLANLGRHSDTAILHRLSMAKGAISAQDRMLQSLSYKNVLKRGYAVVRDEEDRPLSSAALISAGQAISLEFADGRVAATAGEGMDTMPPPAAPVPPTKKRAAKPAAIPADGEKQGTLF
ncbi:MULTISPECIES: exodeoxyribonuclease VII large subunit [Rhizobium]|uniref:Exodeoxyribonuclease 7 large subunit n=1 Tax=Rhizobium rhododendri TaxID=2506430 RepID=A0ABY8IGR6_9HYPH|nr:MULTISPECIES: exodeoxyribonuclease VII large subunit [Rhizobium]MBZ5759629.1 exodeoxyribonuclease VII large subunit [Rhizobium sp. VS19-DR96]MBZ5766018.1 exodeoxyribonuclease VII large subunit [Rhizobium sp. VS19-DR129.2]MBZ5772801.1 exodeoxyribonuclease VII large subunit [Rhizobium sp. VS19-DRK62.2]MBZ5786540.1 exodeoxyribonuclease VII large subunit [Rhizobium sp. VS19-DR121]MBZ5804812.1 exodeoxyribonuclease VII large subunit [Rhizobium sp. VS19-DR181]